jgi:hypothetical protein
MIQHWRFLQETKFIFYLDTALKRMVLRTYIAGGRAWIRRLEKEFWLKLLDYLIGEDNLKIVPKLPRCYNCGYVSNQFSIAAHQLIMTYRRKLFCTPPLDHWLSDRTPSL